MDALLRAEAAFVAGVAQVSLEQHANWVHLLASTADEGVKENLRRLQSSRGVRLQDTCLCREDASSWSSFLASATAALATAREAAAAVAGTPHAGEADKSLLRIAKIATFFVMAPFAHILLRQ